MKEDNNQVEKKHHFSTVGSCSEIVKSWNAMDESGKQGMRDLSVEVLEPCSRLIDESSIEKATTHLSKATRNLETHVGSVTYQPNRPSSNTSPNQTPWMDPKSKSAQNPTHIITKDPTFTPIKPNTKSPPFNPKSPPMDPKSTLQAHPHPYIRECKQKLSSTSPPNSPISLSKKLKTSVQAPSLQFSLNNLPQLSVSNLHSLLSLNPIPVASSSRHPSRRTSLTDQAKVKVVSRAVRFKNGRGNNSETLNLSSDKPVVSDNSSALTMAEEAGLIMPPKSP
nr:hypothetical protein CFP56_78437 [Quercus suber]